MAPLNHKKGRGTSKLCFTHKDQSGCLNFELSYNERTLISKLSLIYQIVMRPKLSEEIYKTKHDFRKQKYFQMSVQTNFLLHIFCSRSKIEHENYNIT